MPTKFFEALGFGKPVVTTDIGGIGRIVRDEECGTILESVDSESIAAQLRPLLRSGEVRREMGRRGVLAIREKYSWDESASTLLKAYAGLNRVDEKEANLVG